MPNWIGLLKSVPWGEVVGKAPQIAEGAKSLWGAVARRVRGDDDDQPDETRSATTGPLPEERLAALEASQRELRAQLGVSAELIDALAQQNRALIEQLDALQRRSRWLAGLTAAALLLAGLACVTLWRPF